MLPPECSSEQPAGGTPELAGALRPFPAVGRACDRFEEKFPIAHFFPPPPPPPPPFFFFFFFFLSIEHHDALARARDAVDVREALTVVPEHEIALSDAAPRESVLGIFRCWNALSGILYLSIYHRSAVAY